MSAGFIGGIAFGIAVGFLIALLLGLGRSIVDLDDLHREIEG